MCRITSGVDRIMGKEIMYENINDFETDELDEIQRTIMSEITDRLRELPRWNKECCLNQNADCTQEEFEECEGNQASIYITEGLTTDVMFSVEKCIVCGGEREKYDD